MYCRWESGRQRVDWKCNTNSFGSTKLGEMCTTGSWMTTPTPTIEVELCTESCKTSSTSIIRRSGILLKLLEDIKSHLLWKGRHQFASSEEEVQPELMTACSFSLKKKITYVTHRWIFLSRGMDSAANNGISLRIIRGVLIGLPGYGYVSRCVSKMADKKAW